MSSSESRAAGTPMTADQPKFILSLRVGGSLMALSLTRYSCADEPPSERTICYLDNGDERLFLGNFKNGQWRNGHGKLLTVTPTNWFKIEILG